MAKKAYIVLAHTFRPADGENTSMKDFGKKGKWTMMEDCYFVTRLRKRYWDHSTTIINLTDAKIEKNSAETKDYNKIVQHVMIKYPQHFNAFVKECKDGGLINKGVSEEQPTE